MAKAKTIYSGYDSYGRAVEVAERVGGAWFWREYGFNGYRRSWSKWEPMEAPEFPAKIKSFVEFSDSPEYIEIPADQRKNRISWGGNTLNIIPGPHRVRLPNY